jgi:glycosyltransferase involved in cell wall biosynthesis
VSLSVSVVIPAYNAARFLSASLDSILAQTHPPLEVLVMDDASTDDTGRVAAAYGSRVRHVRQPSNKGIYANVNDGITMARGDLIATYHADDIYEPPMLERQVRVFEQHPSVGAVFCLDIFVDEGGTEYHRLRLPHDVPGSTPLQYPVVVNALLRHKNAFLVCPTAMVRASVHRDVGLYDQDRWRNSSDLDMWLRIAARRDLLVLNEHLMRYRHFEDQSSRRYHKLRVVPERFFDIMDHHLAHGARTVAAPDALRAYEAHRAEDSLMVAVNRYVLEDVSAAGDLLRKSRLRHLLGSHRIQRGRLAVLYIVLRMACAIPRSRLFATLLAWRWHLRPRPARGGDSLIDVLRAYWDGRDPAAAAR